MLSDGEMKFQDTISRAMSFIKRQYPQSKNGAYYITLRNGRKVFWDKFIKKYGIDGMETRYKKNDVMRRIKLVEFFGFFMQLDLTPGKHKNTLLLESEFYRMVILEKKNKRGSRYQLLSFYDL